MKLLFSIFLILFTLHVNCQSGNKNDTPIVARYHYDWWYYNESNGNRGDGSSSVDLKYYPSKKEILEKHVYPWDKHLRKENIHVSIEKEVLPVIDTIIHQKSGYYGDSLYFLCTWVTFTDRQRPLKSYMFDLYGGYDSWMEPAPYDSSIRGSLSFIGNIATSQRLLAEVFIKNRKLEKEKIDTEHEYSKKAQDSVNIFNKKLRY